MGLENPIHIIIILVVLLMVFGAKRLPEMGKGLGEGMRGFKESLSGNHQPDLEAPVVPQAPAASPEPAATSASSTHDISA